jgi:hypothetical protein
MKGCLALVVVLFGCASQSSRWQSRPYVSTVGSPDEPLRAPPGQALVVFVKPSDYESVESGLRQSDYPRLLAGRPSLWRPNRVDTIIDEHGRYLGDILPMSHFGAAVEPGRHLFTAVRIPDVFAAGNVRGLEAELEAGKAYFVEIGSGEAYDLLAIKPDSASWTKRESWLATTTRLAPNHAAGEAELREFAGYADWCVTHARENLAQKTGEARTRHQLGPADGI